MKSLFTIFLYLPLLGLADTVEVTDGSVLQGKILGMTDGNLTIQTSFAGKIKIHHTQMAQSKKLRIAFLR